MDLYTVLGIFIVNILCSEGEIYLWIFKIDLF